MDTIQKLVVYTCLFGHAIGTCCCAAAASAFWIDGDTAFSIDLVLDSAVLHNQTTDTLTIDSIRIFRDPELVPDGLVQFLVRPYRPGLSQMDVYGCMPNYGCPGEPLRIPPQDSSWFLFGLKSKIEIAKSQQSDALYDTASVLFVVYAAGTIDTVTIVGKGWDPTNQVQPRARVRESKGIGDPAVTWDIRGRRLSKGGARTVVVWLSTSGERGVRKAVRR